MSNEGNTKALLSDDKLRPIYVEAFNKAMQETTTIEAAGLIGLRAVADAAVQAEREGQEPVAWHTDYGNGLIQYVTDSKYQKFAPAIQRHYRPYTTPPAALVVLEVIATLDSVLAQLDEGFIRCETCGNQEHTKDMDVVSYLKEARAMLAAIKQEGR